MLSTDQKVNIYIYVVLCVNVGCNIYDISSF